MLVHQFRIAGEPASMLLDGAYGGALQPFDTLVLPGFGGTIYHVTVKAMNTQNASATVEIGSGRGPALPRFGIEGMRLNERIHPNP